MNRDQVQGGLTQLKGKIREKWGKLTDDEFDKMAGQRDQLVGRIQQLYGDKREDIEKELKRMEQQH